MRENYGFLELGCVYSIPKSQMDLKHKIMLDNTFKKLASPQSITFFHCFIKFSKWFMEASSTACMWERSNKEFQYLPADALLPDFWKALCGFLNHNPFLKNSFQKVSMLVSIVPIDCIRLKRHLDSVKGIRIIFTAVVFSCLLKKSHIIWT